MCRRVLSPASGLRGPGYAVRAPPPLQKHWVASPLCASPPAHIDVSLHGATSLEGSPLGSGHTPEWPPVAGNAPIPRSPLGASPPANVTLECVRLGTAPPRDTLSSPFSGDGDHSSPEIWYPGQFGSPEGIHSPLGMHSHGMHLPYGGSPDGSHSPLGMHSPFGASPDRMHSPLGMHSLGIYSPLGASPDGMHSPLGMNSLGIHSPLGGSPDGIDGLGAYPSPGWLAPPESEGSAQLLVLDDPAAEPMGGALHEEPIVFEMSFPPGPEPFGAQSPGSAGSGA